MQALNLRPLGSVEPKILSLLSAEEAVSLFRALLWAKASRAGVGPALVSVPGAINVADGGIDAEISRVPEQPGGPLFEGITRYQIKTGHSRLETILRKKPFS